MCSVQAAAFVLVSCATLAKPCTAAVIERESTTVIQASAGAQQDGAPIERRPQPPSQPGSAGPNHQYSQPGGPRVGGFLRPHGEHLAEWMNQHQGMTLEQQERALEQEPGFNELPTPTQQRMRGRLAQLNEMSPAQRQRIIQHTEAMERLSPVQRAEVRQAMQVWGALPLDQRKAVGRSFRQLRQLPPQQRMNALFGPQYAWMNLAQRSALTQLIHVAPLLPPDEHGQ